MSKFSIVCVDDEKIILDSLKTQLRSIFGNAYSYEIAEDAQEAFELIEELVQDKTKVLLVISDYIMPGMYGDEFLIRLHEKHPEIKKILLTGQANEKAIDQMREQAELLFCIRKPWTARELESMIRKGLDAE
ncbi:MAG: response regulator [Microscillaceae bacterium]|nr:response regulator [Microscillaceae bacterium]